MSETAVKMQKIEITRVVTYKYVLEVHPKRLDSVIGDEEEKDITDVIVEMNEDDDDSRFEHTFNFKEVE